MPFNLSAVGRGLAPAVMHCDKDVSVFSFETSLKDSDRFLVTELTNLEQEIVAVKLAFWCRVSGVEPIRLSPILFPSERPFRRLNSDGYSPSGKNTQPKKLSGERSKSLKRENFRQGKKKFAGNTFVLARIFTKQGWKFAVLNRVWFDSRYPARAYRIQNSRKLLRNYILSFFVTLLLILYILLYVSIFIVTDDIIASLRLAQSWSFVINLVKMGIMFICLSTGISIIYMTIPNKRLKLRQSFRGAMTAAALWILATAGFEVYIGNFKNFSNVYGTIGGIIVLLLWLYIVSLAILTGNEVNAMNNS